MIYYMSMTDVESFLKEYLKKRPLFLSLIRAKEAELFQKFLPLKKPVLDVGVGDGFFTNVLLTPLRVEPLKVVEAGLDLKESRIEEARKLGIYKQLVTYDGKHLPFPDEHFSTVISNCVLEHVLDLKALLKEVYRVLKPNGTFLTTVMAKPWEDHLYGAKIFGRFYKDWMRKKQIHRNLLTNDDWDKVFRKTGFRIERKIGYLSPKACQLIDICHYLSIASLITYKLFGRWVLFPQLSSLYPINFLSSILSEPIRPESSGAVFYVLRK